MLDFKIRNFCFAILFCSFINVHASTNNSWSNDNDSIYSLSLIKDSSDLNQAKPSKKNISKLAQTNSLAEQPYSPRFTVGPFYSTDVNYFTLFDGFVPFTINRQHILFVDGRYYDNSGSTYEYNIGLGSRNLIDHNQWMLGAYSFFDQRRSITGNIFNQVTVGGEAQTNHLFLSVNGYIPVGKTTQRTSEFNSVAFFSSGTYENIYYSVGLEKALYGIDGLMGYRIPHAHGLALYLGAFHYWRNNTRSLTGPIIHAEESVYLADYQRLPHFLQHFNLHAVADYQYDNVRGSRWFAGGRIDFLFLAQRLSGIEQRMLSFVRRDLNIESEKANDNFKPYFCRGHICRVQRVNNEGAWNTARADVNTDIIGVNGTISGINADTLSANQIVDGGNFMFSAEGEVFAAPVGISGALTNGGGANLIVLASGNTIENITLSGGTQLISNNAGATVGNLVVQDVIATSGDEFLDVTINDNSNNNFITLQNNVSSTSGVDALTIIPNSAGSMITLVMTGNNVTNTNGAGTGLNINVNNGALNITEATNNSVTSSNQAFRIISQTTGELYAGTISNNTFSSTGSLAIDFNIRGPALLDSFTSNSVSTSANNFAGNFQIFNAAGSLSFTSFSNNNFNNTATNSTRLRLIDQLGGPITMSNFFNNSFTSVGGGNDIEFNQNGTGAININVNQTTTCLSAANDNAVLNVIGTVNISPCQ